MFEFIYGLLYVFLFLMVVHILLTRTGVLTTPKHVLEFSSDQNDTRDGIQFFIVCAFVVLTGFKLLGTLVAPENHAKAKALSLENCRTLISSQIDEKSVDSN